jgi:phosphoglycolate phosphatase-like HAD superfamily hydrolase
MYFLGFIFDVEGTLVDSVPQNVRSLQDALERHGYRVPYQTLHLYSGLDGDQALQVMLPEITEGERAEIIEEKCAIYERDYLASVKPIEGVRDVFQSLTEHGGRVALATDCKGRAFKRYMAIINADDFIAATACGDDMEHGKPDPRHVGMALHKLASPASRSVMVGDTPYDAEAGFEAGTKAAGVLTGGFSFDALVGAGCYALANDVGGLLENLLTGDKTLAPKQLNFSKIAHAS